jgi:putative OPT family oligopeptide transporter
MEAAPLRKRTASEIERQWYETVYAGEHAPQLTFRAVFMGMLLGGVMSLSNLYVGLKIGWGLGVAITACILSFAIFKVVPLDWMQAPRGLRLFDRHREREISILENNCMQSTASAAGYGTGATLVSAFSAYLMITGRHLPFWTAVALVFFLAMLGVFMAVPMKRSMINIEQLPFPSGTAAAETLRSLHSRGGEAARRARGLFGALGLGGTVAWFRDGRPSLLPSYWPVKQLFEKLGWAGAARIVDPAGYTLALEFSTIMAAAGAIMGLRTAASMAIGAALNYGLLAPWLVGHGVIRGLGFRSIVSWSVWGGVACMTAAGLLSFFWEWRTILRAFGALATVFGGSKQREDDPLSRIEVPGSWFVSGTLVATAGAVIINRMTFGIPVLLGLLAVLISFVLAIVACRATGETDTTPVGALGKITQLAYGVLIPQNLTANLMTANVTASVAAESADLLTDLKSGYLLGANPRKQFLAQFFGVFAGAIAATGGFYLLVRDASALGGNEFPAPAAQVWKAVAQLLARGVHALPPYALAAIWVGLLVGAALTAVEKLWPRAHRFLPSPTGLGLAFVVQGYSSISIFIGACIAALYRRARPKAAETYTIPVASGFIAGESLVGILVAVLTALKVLA